MEEDYKSNSHKSRENQVQKVVSGQVVQKKKDDVKKFSDAIITGDLKSVKDYILKDVLIPTIKKSISDIVCNGVNILLGQPKNERSVPGGRVSYRNYYDDRNGQQKPSTAYDYDDLTFESRGDAEMVLYNLQGLIETYQYASVADLYDLAGKTCDYTSNKYGWTNLDRAYVDRVYDGYIIRLPKAQRI